MAIRSETQAYHDEMVRLTVETILKSAGRVVRDGEEASRDVAQLLLAWSVTATTLTVIERKIQENPKAFRLWLKARSDAG